MFKVGDKVRALYEPSNPYTITKDGWEGVVTMVEDDYIFVYGDGCFCYQGFKVESKYFELISSGDSEDKKMNTLEKFKLAFKSEPEKTFRKLGITNGDDLLTDDGVKIFLGYLLEKSKNDFKKEVCDPMLEELKEEK